MPAPSAPSSSATPKRYALSKEPFADWHAREPDRFHCFCGSDQDLIDAITEIRAQRERERANDDEIGD
jgi:hypothetical protein